MGVSGGSVEAGRANVEVGGVSVEVSGLSVEVGGAGSEVTVVAEAPWFACGDISLARAIEQAIFSSSNGILF